MTELLHSLATPPAATAWPDTVVCGTDGSSEAREAVRQAAELLAVSRGALELIMITRGFGLRDDSATALAEAQRIARTFGVGATATARTDATAAAGLIRAATHADVLVIGCDALGPTPKAVLRRARCSVLLARRSPDVSTWDTVLLAAEASPRARAVATQLADDHGAELRIAPATELVPAAAALDCGLIIVGDGALALQVARLAPCSVLVIRDQPVSVR